MVFFALLRIGGVGGAPACCIQVPFICFAAIEMLTKTPWEQTEARLRGPRARNWSGRAPLFFPSRPFRRLQCRADENVQPFLLSLTEPLSPSVSPKTAASFLFNGIRGGKETKKELAQSQLDACFLSLFFTKMAPQQLASSRGGGGSARRKTAKTSLVLVLLLAVSALGVASAHPWRSHAAADNSQETSNNNNNAASSSAVQESTKDEAPHSHEPASGMGSRPPTQPPPLPFPQQAAGGSIPASNKAAPRSSGSGTVEVNSVAAGTSGDEAPLAKAPEVAAAAEQPLAPERPPQPPQPRSQHPPTPEQHRAQRQQEREVVREAAHTPMDPEWRRLVRRGFVPASGFRRGGREGGGDSGGGGTLGADAPELEEKVPAVEAILHLDGFQAPETLSVAARDSAIAASIADVLGVPRSSVAVAEAASDGSDAKAPPAAAAAAAAEKPAARRSLSQASAAAAAPKASSPTPAAASPAVAAAAPAAAAKAPAAASPAPAAAAKAPAAASPAPAAAAPAPKPAAAAAAAAPAAAPPAASSLPALKDVIVRVDDQKTGSGGALAKKLAAAAADGTLAKALRSRGFTGADGDATAVGASIAADPTEATWRDRLPFPFWAFIAIVAGAGGLLLLSLLATLVFCCCCTPLMRAARRERSEERKRVKAEAAAAKVAANAELGAQGKGGDDVESGNVKNRRAVAPAPGDALNKDGSAPVDVSSTIKLLRDYAGELQMGGNGAAVVAAAAGAVAATGAAATAAAAASPAALDARALAATKRSHLPPAPRLDDEEETIPGTPSAAAAAAAAAGEHSSVSDADEAASVLASPRSLALPSRELTARLDAANARLAAYVGSLTVKTAAPVVASLLASLRARAVAASAPPPASEDEAALHAAARALVDAGTYGAPISAADPKKARTAAAKNAAPARFAVGSARVATATTVAAVGTASAASETARRRSSAGGGAATAGSSGAPVDITLFVDGSEFESARTFASVARDAEFVPTVLEIEPPGALVPGAVSGGSSSAPALAGIVSERGRYSLGEWLAKHRMANALASSRDLGSPVVPAQAARVALVHSLEALAYLHARGLCHRDVTPDTLKWHDAGRRWRLALPRASRWARSGASSAPLSYALRYAAPEVVAADALSAGRRLAAANAAAADSANTAAGAPRDGAGRARGAGSGLAIAERPSTFTADPASDVWAVGLLAWEAFAGRPLFGEAAADGSSAATMSDEQVAAALLGFRKLPFEADPSMWVSFADGGAAELVKAMLSRAPDARPSAVQALRAATKLAASARN